MKNRKNSCRDVRDKLFADHQRCEKDCLRVRTHVILVFVPFPQKLPSDPLVWRLRPRAAPVRSLVDYFFLVMRFPLFLLVWSDGVAVTWFALPSKELDLLDRSSPASSCRSRLNFLSHSSTLLTAPKNGNTGLCECCIHNSLQIIC